MGIDIKYDEPKKSNLIVENEENRKNFSKVVDKIINKTNDQKLGRNFEKNEVTYHQILWYLGPSHVLEGQETDFLVKKGLGALKWGFIKKT